MTFHRAACGLGLFAAVFACGAAAAQTPLARMQAALDTNVPPGGLNSPSPDPVPGGITPAAVDPVQGPVRPQTAGAREPRGNPLWAISLKSLSATRERPIFLPSRRPPAPAVAGPPPVVAVAAPPPPAGPDRPRLALVGAVAGEAEGIAIFVDETTRDIVRLRTGESHSGWMLRSVRGREATLQRDSETVLLALPALNDPAAAGIPGIPGLPGVPGVPGGKGEPDL